MSPDEPPSPSERPAGASGTAGESDCVVLERLVGHRAVEPLPRDFEDDLRVDLSAADRLFRRDDQSAAVSPRRPSCDAVIECSLSSPSSAKSATPLLPPSPGRDASVESSLQRDGLCHRKNGSSDRKMIRRSNPAHPSTNSMKNPPNRRSATRGSGWGTHPLLRLRGGADSVSNGTSGWGPPPASSSSAGTGGWGSAPPANNPSGSSAWGAPSAGPGAASVMQQQQSQQQQAQQQQQQPGGVDDSKGSVATSAASAAPAVAGGPPSGPQTSGTSWAAAAGKGLPVTEASNSGGGAGNAGANSTASSSTSKQLEELNSVREALFSQDGWGGAHVKQDTSWDVDSRANGDGASGGGGLNAKDNDWNSGRSGNRNDGTDLWKSTLSGAPPPQSVTSAPSAKAQMNANNPWGSHAPQNPTDFKNWGDDDEHGRGDGPHNSASGSHNESMWRDNNHSQYGKPPGNDWNKPDSRGPPPPNSGWNAMDNGHPRDKPRGDMMGGPGSSSGWGGNPGHPGPMGRQPNPSHWNSGNNGGGGKWGDIDSPVMQKRGGGDMDNGGTSLWGSKGNNMNSMQGASNWKDMPIPNNMTRAPMPHQQPNPRLSGNPNISKEPWGTGVPTRGGGGNWGSMPDDSQGGSGWGDDKGAHGGWGSSGGMGGGGGDNWNKPRNRGSPNSGSGGGWGAGPNNDENGFDPSGSSGWGKPDMKPQQPGISKEAIWNSKQFRILVHMGYRKEDIEQTLRQTNMRLEDALEMLNPQSRMPRNAPPMGGDMPHHNLYGPGDNDGPRGGGGGHAFSPDGQPPPNNHPMMGGPGNFGGLPNLPGSPTPTLTSGPPPPRGGGPGQGPAPNSQPSASQLRLLVQQIQMAVRAGHLNPQILNQPLAPQTLILLNQLLQQIKNLQALQQQIQMTGRNADSGTVMTMNMNITKTKQHIQNLQNQISAQQANYLKTPLQNNIGGNGVGPGSGNGAASGVLGDSAPGGASAGSVQDMFSNISLGGSGGNDPLGPQGPQSAGQPANGSRLALWKVNKDVGASGGVGNNANSFMKAPGASGAGPKLPGSGNLLLDEGPWGSSNSSSNNGGWPEKSAVSSGDGNSDFGIPEFEPGKPWKGPGVKNPDEDPNLTPGSMAPTAVQLKSLPKSSGGDNVSVDLTSPTWSFGKNDAGAGGPGGKDPWSGLTNANGTSASGNGNNHLTQIGQDLWGKSAASSSRSPPGLNANSTSNGWGNSAGSPNGWSSGNSDGGPTWLLLKNLTAQIDGSTLKTLCMQHGPVKNFELFLSHNIALAKYTSARDTQKAQKALHNCLLSNTTIHADMVSDDTANSIMVGAARIPATSVAAVANTRSSLKSSNDMWGSSGALFNAGVNASVWGAPDAGGANLNSFLPGDLLGENN